jgi:uncharacterized protein (TIGR03790 family)
MLATSCSPTRDTVVVIVNAESPVSIAIGAAYRARYDIPERNLLELHIPLADPLLRSDAHETISRSHYETRVRDPIAQQLIERGLQNSTEILVTTKGVPLRIAAPKVPLDTWLRDSRASAVDAELMLLFSRWDGTAGVVELANPYFRSELSFRDYRREADEGALPRYLVARLTGYADEDAAQTGVPRSVSALLEAADQPPASGTRWLVDADATHTGAYASGDRVLLEATAGALRALGLDVVHDREATFRADVAAIQGYTSWGSNDSHDAGAPYYGPIGSRTYPGRFAPRALVADFVSTSARTFSTPPSYGQSLVADLLRLGAAGAGGHVWEPTLPGVHRPHLLLARYARGATAVEAFWSSVPFLGWMNTWIGDPLLRLDPAPAANTADRDGDGVRDSEDNCTLIPNPKQRDTDSDGYGNFCDGDINNDGLVTTSWGTIFPLGERGDVEWIALTAESPLYDENHDLDGDGLVGATDIAIAQLGLYHAPGPSGTRDSR